MGVYVEGLREYTRAFERAGVDVEELKDVMGGIADEAARVMRSFIPSRSGALRASVRGNRAKGRAIVTAGKARVPYAAAIQWGWGSSHHNYKHGRYSGFNNSYKGAHYVQKTDAVMDDRVGQMLAEGWNEIAKRHGLT